MDSERLGRVGIVGAGGGFRGISIVGFLESFINHGLHKQWKYGFGVSVSAIILSAFSRAKKTEDYPLILKKVIDQFSEIEKFGPDCVFDFSKIGIVRHAFDESLMDNSHIFRLLEGMDPKECLGSPLRFEFAVQSKKFGRKRVFSNNMKIFADTPELFRTAVGASACLPPFFGPVQFAMGSEGDVFSDGFSIYMDGAIKTCDTIFVLFPYPQRYSAPQPLRFRWLSNFVINYEIQLRETDRQILNCAISHAKLNGGPRIIPVYADNAPPSLGTLRFSKPDAGHEGDLTLGRRAALATMDRQLRKLGI